MEDLVPALVVAITEAVHDGDGRTVRRLLARFAEVATIADLYVLRDALIHGDSPACTAPVRTEPPGPGFGPPPWDESRTTQRQRETSYR